MLSVLKDLQTHCHGVFQVEVLNAHNEDAPHTVMNSSAEGRHFNAVLEDGCTLIVPHIVLVRYPSLSRQIVPVLGYFWRVDCGDTHIHLLFVLESGYRIALSL